MAKRGVMEVSLALGLMIAMLWGHAAAQSSCTTALLGLTPCLSYIGGNSSAPSSSCCSQLASVVQNEPRCLCTLVNNTGAASSLGLTINVTQALGLPAACNVKTPPISACNAAGAAPAATPKAAPDTPSTTPATPTSGSSGKNDPSTSGESSGASSIMGSQSLLLATMFVAACVSYFSNI